MARVMALGVVLTACGPGGSGTRQHAVTISLDEVVSAPVTGHSPFLANVILTNTQHIVLVAPGKKEIVMISGTGARVRSVAVAQDWNASAVRLLETPNHEIIAFEPVTGRCKLYSSALRDSGPCSFGVEMRKVEQAILVGRKLVVVGLRSGSNHPLHVFDDRLLHVTSFGWIRPLPVMADSTTMRWGLGVAGSMNDSSFVYADYVGGGVYQYSVSGRQMDAWSIGDLEGATDATDWVRIRGKPPVLLDLFPRITGVVGLDLGHPAGILVFWYDPALDRTTIRFRASRGASSSGSVDIPLRLLGRGSRLDLYVLRWVNQLELARYSITVRGPEVER